MTCLRRIAKHPTICLIDSSTTLPELKQIHAHLLARGALRDPLVFGQFVTSVALENPCNIGYSDRILGHCEAPSLFALNSMIRAHSKSSTPELCFYYYREILDSENRLLPDNYTFNFLIRACTQILEPTAGHCAHSSVIKHGFHGDPHVESGLIRMYAEFGQLGCCRKVFNGIPDPDLVCRTAMLTACASCGDVRFAEELFNEMAERDDVAWNAMIASYAQCGKSKRALELFHAMQMEGVTVNEVSMVSVLSACSHLGSLDQGRWAHSYITRNKIRVTVTLGTALIDMYGKCGDTEHLMEVFWGMKERNVYTWSSAMNGLAMSGMGRQCLDLYSQMKRDGIVPNKVTLISVLRACNVVGFVEEGLRHFESMKGTYGIEPELEHYGCVVDLYGRAGLVDEALSFISEMPMEPHAAAWGALLNACRIHKKIEIGKLAARKIVELEAKHHGAYVLLSNMYAENKTWESVDDVRRMMKNRGVKKPRGCSVMEVDGQLHEFFVGDISHPMYDEISVMLGEISRRLKLVGYVANMDPILFDVEDEEKEGSLFLHSEKVAIAFGLISLKQGTPIRIVKNLRVCLDCHDVTKLISGIFGREIIVRDRNRFHHFKGGECSCGDYW
ncbi:hypothetical protein MLD38_037917 [Melastoma candidum]|uniref:Uncharacterized protein n=1 Tax=Melastoma candidum TaxID=119954 RepID=A0ACB9KXW1_9MYRT|nr:hypothetical protein MLD38_037917 [Melastoma candidum]